MTKSMMIRGCKGFTLMENVVALILITALAISALNFSSFLVKFIKDQEARLTIFSCNASQLEDLKEIAKTKYDDPKLISGTYTPSTGALTTPPLPTGFSIVNYNVVDKDIPLTVGSNTYHFNYKIVTVTSRNTVTGLQNTMTGFVVEPQ